MAVNLDHGIIAGLVRKEGAWSKISRALSAQLLTQAPPLLKVLDPPLMLIRLLVCMHVGGGDIND